MPGYAPCSFPRHMMIEGMAMKTTARWVSLVGISASLFVSAAAFADRPPVTWIQLAPGIGGPETARGGAGNEQPSVATVVSGGRRYVVSVYMSSNVSTNDRPW